MQVMKAAVVHASGTLCRSRRFPFRGAPGPVLVKVAACGVCHTDLHAADGDWPVKPTLPFIPGHEGVGHVAAVGAGVKGVARATGRRALAAHRLRPLRDCITGWETLCDGQQMTGYTVNGGYAEYVVADPGYVGHLPAKVASRTSLRSFARESPCTRA